MTHQLISTLPIKLDIKSTKKNVFCVHAALNYRNVGNKTPSEGVSHLSKKDTSTTPLRKPKNKHITILLKGSSKTHTSIDSGTKAYNSCSLSSKHTPL